MIETAVVLGIAGFNFLGIAALYSRLGRVEAKFKLLPCYSLKEFNGGKVKKCK
jgi:hypothetical protein